MIPPLDSEWWARETFAFVRSHPLYPYGGDDGGEAQSARFNITYIFEDIHSKVSEQYYHKITHRLNPDRTRLFLLSVPFLSLHSCVQSLAEGYIETMQTRRFQSAYVFSFLKSLYLRFILVPSHEYPVAVRP